MPVDAELLAILACPACDERPPVALCRLKDEEPVVTEGLSCSACGRVYAIVSDIPVMLVDEALPADARA